MRKLFLASYKETVDTVGVSQSQELTRYKLVAAQVNDDWTEEQEIKWAKIVLQEWFKAHNNPAPFGISIEPSAKEWIITQEAIDDFNDFLKDSRKSKRVNPLLSPANYSLQEIFAELKFGRPANAQHYLQERINELNAGCTKGHVGVKVD